MTRWLIACACLAASCASAGAQTRPAPETAGKHAAHVIVLARKPEPPPGPTLSQSVQDLGRAVADLRSTMTVTRMPVTFPVGRRCFDSQNPCAEKICAGFNFSHGYYSEMDGGGFVTCYQGAVNDAVSTTMK